MKAKCSTCGSDDLMQIDHKGPEKYLCNNCGQLLSEKELIKPRKLPLWIRKIKMWFKMRRLNKWYHDKHLFHQDQAEWYVICTSCYEVNAEFQWSGSTRVHDFSRYQQETIDPAVRSAKHCEWCKKKFGGKPTEKTGLCQFTRY